MCSQAPGTEKRSSEDSVNIYIKNPMEKRGKWFSSRPILSCDQKSGAVRLPVANGKLIAAALEDVHPEITQETYAEAVQEVIDTIYQDISTMHYDAPLIPSDP